MTLTISASLCRSSHAEYCEKEKCISRHSAPGAEAERREQERTEGPPGRPERSANEDTGTVHQRRKHGACTLGRYLVKTEALHHIRWLQLLFRRIRIQVVDHQTDWENFTNSWVFADASNIQEQERAEGADPPPHTQTYTQTHKTRKTPH